MMFTRACRFLPLLVLFLGLPLGRADEVPVVLSAKAAESVRLAAQDLVVDLARLYPQEHFSLTTDIPTTSKAILVGQSSEAWLQPHLAGRVPTASESFIVATRQVGGLTLGLIAGADSRGTVDGIYQILAQLGAGFYLSGDTFAGPKTEAFSFAGWRLENAPLVRERLVFNWHNFLSGCSTWNLPDWQKWIVQSQKQGFNAIMVHAYGNNPMAGFTFQGKARPVGYLSTTVKGRDWSTMHVNDVRRMIGGEAYDQMAFGSAAGLAPDDQRVAAAQALMHDVFAEAARREMGIYFAVDVDTASANPQELIKMLPESARFQAGEFWLPNPDTAEGYEFFKAQVTAWCKVYPQITKLVVWFRSDKSQTPWMGVHVADMPPAWRDEWAGEIRQTPGAEHFWGAPGLFAIGKIIRAYDRALKELGNTTIQLAAGTWRFDFLSAGDRFFPSGVPLIGLDYGVIEGKPQLDDAALRAPLRAVGTHRPVIPIVWAHHDDGQYFGSPYTPLSGFAAKLQDAKAGGYGIIHWMTRPLDLYFSSLSQQVWQRTQNELLGTTCDNMAANSFGESNRKVMGHYLESWITEGPKFCRETSDYLIDRLLTNRVSVMTQCRERLKQIETANLTVLTPEQRDRLDYQRSLEQFILLLQEAQGQFENAEKAYKKGDWASARNALNQCHPEAVIRHYAQFSALGGMSRGEQGFLVSLNTRWLSHIVRLRQCLNLEPVRMNFGPTSHDPLAQSVGRLTCYFDDQQHLWQTLGTAETGVSTFSCPAADQELGRHGITSRSPVELKISPIVRPANLLPGLYQLRLMLIDPASTAAGQSVFRIQVNQKDYGTVDVFQEAGGPNRLVEKTYACQLDVAGPISLKLTPVQGAVALSGVVLETSPSGEH